MYPVTVELRERGENIEKKIIEFEERKRERVGEVSVGKVGAERNELWRGIGRGRH